ncbi:hypothetical protein V8E51_013862 [Hyaloscypha variabilis]
MSSLTERLFSRTRKTDNDRAQPAGEGSTSTVATKPPRSREKFGLFVLYEPEVSEHCNVDIVAIHGLGGDWEGTWTDDTTGKMWLKDFVPQAMPSARVLSFGYDSEYALSNTVADIDDAARSLIDRLDGERQEDRAKQRPIIFVAHSLGGIVVKRGLILANERSDHWKDIRDSAAGIIFFAVPHRGADIAYWANIATNALNLATLGARGNANFVRSLQKNSPEFANISQAFIQPAAQFTVIRTFYETVKIGNQLIVDKDSASLGITNEVSVPIHGANHRDICKFEYPESQRYKPVRNALQMIISKLEQNDNTLIRDQAQIQWDQAQTIWRNSVSRVLDASEDSGWILHMPEYRQWSVKTNIKPLFIEYESKWNWQVALAKTLEQDLQSRTELLWGFCPEPSNLGYLNEFKSSLAQSLIGQLIIVDPDCVGRVHEILQQIEVRPSLNLPAKPFAQQCQILWKAPFSSNQATWRHHWAILASLLRSTTRHITIILLGFFDEAYTALDDGLQYLSTISFSNSNRGFQVSQLVPSVFQDCLASLYFPELHARRDRVEKADRGTNQWIWKHPVYANWYDESSGSFLWIYGKPGSGKSTLAATLLHSLRRSESNYLTADFFYSARGGPTEVSHTFMLRSILYQLLNNDRNTGFLYPAFQDTYRKLRSLHSGSIAWSYDDLSSILQYLAGNLNLETDDRVPRHKFLILIDGVDESTETPSDSPPRAKVLRLLSRLSSGKSHSIFKIIALSRAERDIKGVLQVAYSIDMIDVNRPDIQKIIQLGLAKVSSYMRSEGRYQASESSGSSEIEGDKEQHEPAASYEDFTRDGGLSATPLQELARDLLEHADGVILWVKMIIIEFIGLARSGSCTLSQFQRVRSTTPKRLSDTYSDMILRIGNSRYKNPNLARYIFCWLIYAGRALRIDELREVIALFGSYEDSAELNENILLTNRPLQFETYNPTWTALTNVCGGFIEIRHSHENLSERIHDPSVIGRHDYVQLVHQTARDFILSDPEASILKPDSINSREIIFMICINYLVMTFPLNPRFGVDSNGSEIGIVMFSKIVRLLDDRPLLPYILEQLPGLINTHQLDKPATPAFSQLKSYLHSARKNPDTVTWIILKEWAERNCLLGVEAEDAVSVDSSSSPANEAWVAQVFVAACKLGALTAVKILLAAGNHIVNVEGGLPIFSAAQKGNHLIVEELLRNGANSPV